MITVVYLPNPFKPSSRILKPFTPEEVKTLADLKEHFKIHNPADFIWAINGHHIEDSRLDTAELRAADYVAIVPKIRGGGGGGKNVLGVVAALALVAFTGGAGGGLLGGFLGSQGGMLGLGLALYLGGSLLMGNQKTPTIDAPKYDGAFEGGHGWSVDNIRNKPGSPLPVTFGSIRTSGQLLQRRLVGGMHAGKWTQFLELLLAAGEGPLDSISDIKVNDIPIASISGASYEVKLGTNNQTAVSLGVSQIAEQLTFSSELPISTTTWVTKAMSTPGTRIVLEFVAPAGVYAVQPETGANVDVEIWIRGQYREVGAGSWIDMWPYYPNAERPLGKFNVRQPLYFKEAFAPPDSSKLYEFRMQNYTLQWYNDNYWAGAHAEMPANMSTSITWLSLASNTNRSLTFPGTAIVALSLPATENLSGGMPKVSWTQTRANIYAWNPTTEAYEQKPATNLAWMIYDVIHACRLQYNIQTSSNQHVVYGEPAANIDYDTFDEWATYCGTEVESVARCVGNLLLDSPEQMWPAIQKIATSARSFIIQQAGVFKPVWDAPKTVSQIFTSGNIINGSVKGGFLSEKERATAIEASFLNEDNGFERDTLFVPSDDYNPMSLDNPTQIYFPGLTSSDVVYRACKHILRRNKYLRRTISFQADIDSIVAEIGDVVGVQSDITDWGVGGRIMGATTTKVVIDQAVSLSPEGSYTLLVRAGDGTLTRKAVDAVAEAITTTELNFTGDPWSSAPVRFELYAFGVTELETKPFTITGISRNSDLQATIEGIEYVAGVYSDDTDFPVIDYTAANAAINTLTVNTDTDTGRLMLSWSVPEDRDYGGAWVYIDGKPYGFIVADQHDITIDMPPGTYGVTVLPIDGNGRGGTAVEQEVTLGQLTVADVSSVSLTSEIVSQADNTNLVYIKGTLTIPTLATSVLVEIGEGAKPTAWFTVQDSRIASVRYGPVKPGTLYSLRFTAKNRYAVADPVTETITTAGDTEAPGAPTSVVVNGTLQFMRIFVGLDNPPNDLAGFKIYRGTSEIAAQAQYVGSVACTDGTADFVDKVQSYTDIYYYFAKAFDIWKNLSNYSVASAPVQAFKILDADILRQLTPADALNTDPYFQDFSAWSSDLEDTAANPDNFVTISDGPAGTTGFKSASGEKLIFTVDHDALIPYDATRKYVLTAYMRATGGGSHGLGFCYYDASKTLLDQSDSLEYAVAADTTWTQFSKTPGTVPEGTAFLGPLIVCNNGESAGVVLEVQKLRLREVLTSDMLVVNEAVITVAAQIANAVITSAHIANLDASKITSGTIDTDRFSANFADIRHLSVLGKNLVDDPSLLSFAEDFEPTGSDDKFLLGAWELAADANIPTNGTLGTNTPYVGVESHEDQSDYVLIGNGLVIAPFAATNRIWLAQKVSVTENVTYALSAYVLKGWLENAVCPPFQLLIDWYGADDTKISQDAGDCDDTEGGRFYIDATAPLGSRYALIYLVFQPGAPTSPAFYMGVVSALQFERSEDGATFWAGREQGTILADRIFAGILKSLNWSSSAGSYFDLESGTFQLGGSANPQLTYDGETLTVGGTLAATIGAIGGLTLAANKLTAGTRSSQMGLSGDSNLPPIWAGSDTPSSAPFRVARDGSIFSIKGLIGGFTLASNAMTYLKYSGETLEGATGMFIDDPLDGSFGAIGVVMEGPTYNRYCVVTGDGMRVFAETLSGGTPTDGVDALIGPYYGDDSVLSVEYVTPFQAHMFASTRYGFYTNGRMYAGGGFYPTSDETVKSEIEDVSALAGVRQLRVKQYRLDERKLAQKRREKAIQRNNELKKAGKKIEPVPDLDAKEYGSSPKSIGVMAADFNKIFGTLDGSTETYNLTDAIGVALRAIQELAEIVDEQAAEIAELRAMIQELKK